TLTIHPKRTWIGAAIGLLPFAIGWIKYAFKSLDFVATVQSMPNDLAAFWTEWIVPIAAYLDRVPPWGWMGIGIAIIASSFVADRHWGRISATIQKHRKSTHPERPDGTDGPEASIVPAIVAAPTPTVAL